MYTLNKNMYNIQFVHYVMLLYNITEIRYTDVLSIKKQLKRIKVHDHRHSLPCAEKNILET